MSTVEYVVVYEQADDGYWNAYALDLPVVANADTREEIEVEVREAIEFRLECAREEGKAPTRQANEVSVVQVSVPA